MSGYPTATRLLPHTLAGRFLLIVVAGVLIPLGVVGIWLTRLSEGAGSRLLRTQLSESAEALSAQIRERWVLRAGELELLANNSVAQSLLTDRALTAEDSAYVRNLVHSLAPAFIDVTYADTTGRARWIVEVDSAKLTRSSAPPDDQRSEDDRRSFLVQRPVHSEGHRVGTLTTRVQLSSVVSKDSRQLLVPSGAISIVAPDGIVWSSAPDAVDITSSPAPSGWERVERDLSPSPLHLVLAAPRGPFVIPFERATRLGLGVLAVVAIAALVLAAILTSRATRSLGELAHAAGAVAGGDLDRRVAQGPDDIGQLGAAFNDMTESLRSTLAELSQQRALAAVGEFASALSHEVRNSLTAVRVDLQHAARHLGRDEASGALVARALDSTRQLDATVTSALRMARSGQVLMVPVSISAVLASARHATASAFSENGATLSLPSPVEEGVVTGDPAALEQLFINLLINAAQAMSTGGVAGVNVDWLTDRVSIHIIDDGPGMPHTNGAGIAKAFQSSKPYGTGLGLPIATRIAELHGGSLRVASGNGAGTHIVVDLPRAGHTIAGPPSHSIGV